MTRLLLYIKHKIPIVWQTIDWLNGMLFRVMHRDSLLQQSDRCFEEFMLEGYSFRRLHTDDVAAIFDLLSRQRDGRLEYFNPHSFDRSSLERVSRNAAFLMFGVFCGEKLVGYFFLRCFWNKKCFVGRLIDEPHERNGIGRVMNSILYNTAWGSGFRCFTTVSTANESVMRSHRRNPFAHVVEELPNDYLLIEFVPAAPRDT